MHDSSIIDILAKAGSTTPLSREDALALLRLDTKSPDFYALIGKSNELSRTAYNNQGYIFAQIGLNAAPCSGNCAFCSLARDNFLTGISMEKSLQQVLDEARRIFQERVSALFLMTTADYDIDKFLHIAAHVKNITPPNIRLIANVGDFSSNVAQALRQTGFDGVYHIVRLREGTDTGIDKALRIRTLDSIRAADLALYYCVEPIGQEHSHEELVEEMMRARQYNVDVMAVMRRVNLAGMPFAHMKEVSEIEMTKIAAVARLVTNPKTSMNIHEPMNMPLLAGVNQLYAEFGSNPRDCETATEISRGRDISSVKKMLEQAEYIL